MIIYVFGNPDESSDNRVFEIIKHFPQYNFEFIPPNADLPEISNLNILDTIYGLNKPTLLTEKNIDQLASSPRTTAHDYDLGFQLKYLRKLGKIDKVNIVGIPPEGDIDYDLIHSIFKKLVAQDIQGS
jgi:hypothetical protein